jgi:hypothetical protein
MIVIGNMFELISDRAFANMTLLFRRLSRLLEILYVFLY